MNNRGQFLAIVREQKPFGVDHNCLKLEFIEGSDIFSRCRAGQFIQLACRDTNDDYCGGPLLRRPFSIGGKSISSSGNAVSIEIIYRIIGPGTKWLSRLNQGDKVDVLGPLGNSFTLPADKQYKCIMLGGGIGLPPMFFLAGQMEESGYHNKIAFAGCRTITHIESSLVSGEIYADNCSEPASGMKHFNSSNTPCVIATDDGSCGFRGNIVQALDIYLQQYPDWLEAQLFACGPELMLKAIAIFAEKNNMACQICMEAYMSCGIGVCQSCIVPTKTVNGERKYKLVCANGSVFDAKTIIWD